MEKIRLLLVEEHTLLRQTLAPLLQGHPQLTVVATAGTAAEALRLAVEPPLVLVLGLNRQAGEVLQAVSHLRQSWPAGLIILLAYQRQVPFLKAALQGGARGYVTKTSSPAELVKAILAVAAGATFVCADMQALVLSEEESRSEAPLQLSRRELEIVEWVRQGASSKEIAGRLFLSVKTVDAHRYNILKKLNLKCSAALVNLVNKKGAGLCGTGSGGFIPKKASP